MTAAKWAAPPSGRSSRATAVTTTNRSPIAAAASATRRRLAGVGRPEGPRRHHVAEAAPAGAAAPGDHEGGRPARPAAADVGAGGLLADRDQVGRAHQGLRLHEAARERVLGRDPAGQAPAGAELGQLVRCDVHRLQGLGGALADQPPAEQHVGHVTGRARGGDLVRGRPAGHLVDPERALADHVPTGTLADRGPVRPNDPGAARLRAAGHRAVRRERCCSRRRLTSASPTSSACSTTTGARSSTCASRPTTSPRSSPSPRATASSCTRASSSSARPSSASRCRTTWWRGWRASRASGGWAC